MPRVGEIKNSTELKYVGSHAMIYHACIGCGMKRWVNFRKGKPVNMMCRQCANQKRSLLLRDRYICDQSPHWKGGRTIDSEGYVLIKLRPDSFFYSMTNKQGYVREHRLVMAKHLGRCLHTWELIHHKNGDKADNKVENLQLNTSISHNQITILENKIRNLEKRLTLIEAENELLKSSLYHGGDKPNG